MQKTLLWLFLLLIPVLAACGGQARVEGVNEINEEDTAVQDPLPAANKPQLIEFYADW